MHFKLQEQVIIMREHFFAQIIVDLQLACQCLVWIEALILGDVLWQQLKGLGVRCGIPDMLRIASGMIRVQHEVDKLVRPFNISRRLRNNHIIKPEV
ncbi:hypothetical protein D3C74_438850 [compost metagenome]